MRALVVALVVLSAILGAAAEDRPSREQEHVTRCSALMVQFADRLSARHLARPPSWGWLDGALKQFCEHDDLQTGDAIEFCRFASGLVLGLSKTQADRTHQGPPLASELEETCRHVGSQRWTGFERLRRTACNQYCVARGLPPWRADDYVTTKTVPAYESLCQNRRAVTAMPHDGLGGELLSHLFARARALKFGMFYVYTPISRVQHVNTDKGTLEAMESFLNLGADEVDIRTIKSNFHFVQQ